MKHLIKNDVFSLDRIKVIVSVGALVAIILASMPLQATEADAEVEAAAEVAPAAEVVADEPSPLTDGYVKDSEVPDFDFSVPEYTKVKALRSYQYVPMTAYTSRPEETDDTPFITADGSHVRDGIVACNFLPFGTKVRIPSLFGDKVFEVHDRMNKRYPYKMDIWMADYSEAIQFGVKYAHIEIVETEDVSG
jgi:3D (Asp-Asp-Asp) domain-containing protein